MTKSFPVFAGLSLLLVSPSSATVVGTFVNITTGTGSSATQSTTHPAGPANNAINGNLGDFSHTDVPESGNAWWEVNLGTDRSLSDVRLDNRTSCCGGRLRDLTLYVKDSSGTVISTVTNINAGNVLNSPAFIDVTLPSSLTNARFIRVERTPLPGDPLSHDNVILSLGEVRAMNLTNTLLPSGSDLTHSNIWAMATSQSSTLGGFVAGSAVNGVTNDFTHTDGGDTNPSWTVDFGEVMNLENFNIANRGDGCCQQRLRDITVTVKDGSGAVVYTSPLLNPENNLAGPAALTGNFPGGLQGRYVTISRTPDPDGSGTGGVPGSADDQNVLSMAEVRIFGSSIPEPSSFLLAVAGFGILLRRRR